MGDTDVPQELKQSRKSKDLAAEQAQDKIDNEIPQGQRVICALGYISFLCILPLVLLQDSKFGQFHGKQALVLAVFIYFFDYLGFIQSLSFLNSFLPFTIFSLYTLLKFCTVIFGIYMSMKGQYFKIPLIYGLSEKFQIQIKTKNTNTDPNAVA